MIEPSNSPEPMPEAVPPGDDIVGLQGMTNEQVWWELQHGAKFVEYEYCVSLLVFTWYRSSRIHFIRCHESAVARGMKYTLLSLFAGWWGIPFGPFCTIAAVITNLAGGRNVTPSLHPPVAAIPGGM